MKSTTVFQKFPLNLLLSVSLNCKRYCYKRATVSKTSLEWLFQFGLAYSDSDTDQTESLSKVVAFTS